MEVTGPYYQWSPGAYFTGPCVSTINYVDCYCMHCNIYLSLHSPQTRPFGNNQYICNYCGYLISHYKPNDAHPASGNYQLFPQPSTRYLVPIPMASPQITWNSTTNLKPVENSLANGDPQSRDLRCNFTPKGESPDLKCSLKLKIENKPLAESSSWSPYDFEKFSFKNQAKKKKNFSGHFPLRSMPWRRNWRRKSKKFYRKNSENLSTESWNASPDVKIVKQETTNWEYSKNIPQEYSCQSVDYGCKIKEEPRNKGDMIPKKFVTPKLEYTWQETGKSLPYNITIKQEPTDYSYEI